MVYVKLRKGDIYKMVGDQENYKFNGIDDPQFEVFYKTIEDRIIKLLEEYKELENTFDSIQLVFRVLPYSAEEEERIYNTVSKYIELENKMDKDEYKLVRKNLIIFGNSFEDDIGKPILIKMRGGKLYVPIEVKGKIINFIDILEEKSKNNPKKKEIYSVSSNSIFLYRDVDVRSYIIVLDIINKEKIIKRCFNLFGGIIGKVEDIYDNGIIKRYYGNKMLVINKNKEIEYKSTKIDFSPISKQRSKLELDSKKDRGIPNIKIGVIDLEAYVDKNSDSKAYAIGFYTYLDEKCNTFYIDKTLDNVNLVHTCINEMLRDKYKDITFYCHNFGRYDSAFIYKYLSLFNESEEGIKNPYILDPFKRGDDMIRLIIKRKINGKQRKIKILDSYCVLPRSLKKLCEDYKVEVAKGYFPHKFSSEDTLFYKGKTPSFIFYSKDITYETYLGIKSEN
jgi:hypothetical protein